MTDPAAPDGTPAVAPEGTPPVIPPVIPPTDWHAGYSEDDKGWLNNRGIDKLSAEDGTAALLKGFRNAESSLGVPADRLLKLPQDPKAEGAMDEIFAKLGRPADAAGYELQVGADDSAGVADWAREAFHKAGLSQNQGDALFNSLGGFLTGVMEQSDTATQAQTLADTTALKAEWGTTYDANILKAKSAATKLGIDPAAVEALEAGAGFASVMRMFQTIGSAIGEDGFVSGDAQNFGPGYPTTPAGAKSKIAELKRDAAFTKRYLDNDTEANNMMTNLHVIMAAGRA